MISRVASTSCCASSGAWTCWTTHPSPPSACSCSMYSSRRRIAFAPVRTRSIGVISLSRVRIGLIFSAEPSQAEAGPMRPPRRRYSSVSTANHIFRSARVVSTRSTTSSSDPPACATRAPASAIRPRPPAERSESITVTRSTPLRSASCSLAWRADSTVPGDAARDVHRDDLEALVDERLVGLQEVADRRLRGRRQAVGAAQAAVEVVEVRHVRLALARRRPS